MNLQEFNTFEPKDGLARFHVRRHRKCFDFKKFKQNLEVMPKCTRLRLKKNNHVRLHPCQKTPFPAQRNTFMFFHKSKIFVKKIKIYTYILVIFFVSIRLVELTKVCYKFDTLDLALGVSPTCWT